MKRWYILLFVSLIQILWGQSYISKASNLFAYKQKDGLYVLENNRIKVVIEPKMGGRALSIVNKETGEELVQTFNPNSPDSAGAFYDIVDLSWPGLAKTKYDVKGFGFTKDESKAYIEMSVDVGKANPTKKNLFLTKRISVDTTVPAVYSLVEIENRGGKPIEVTYWHQSRPILGPTNKDAKSTWLPLENDVVEIGFNPGSAGHGLDMFPSAGFAGLTVPNGKSSAVWLFSPSLIDAYWTFHDPIVPTYDLVFKKKVLQPKEKAYYDVSIVLLPPMQNIAVGNLETGFTGSMVATYANGKITVSGQIYKFTPGNFPGGKLFIEIYDTGKNLLDTIKEDTLSEIVPEKFVSYSASATASAKIKGGYYIVVVRVTDPSGVDVYRAERTVKMGEIPIPAVSKPLTINFAWLLNQPIYNSTGKIKANLVPLAPVYSNIVKLYQKHPTVRSDIIISGALLYQWMLVSPQFVSMYGNLIKKGTFNLVATGYGNPLFPFISTEEIKEQIGMDMDIKQLAFGVKPNGFFFPELAYADGVLEPVVQNKLTWGYLSDIAVDTGYKDMPDIDYRKPSRIMSKGFAMNALIRDSKAVNILLKKTDKAIDEFILYVISVALQNKDGNSVIVVANNGEFIGDGEFMDKLFTKLKTIPWIRFKSGEDIFKKVIPTQSFLSEKISGGWYYDIETQTVSYKIWFDHPMKQAIWDNIRANGKKVLEIVSAKQMVSDLKLDTSYPDYLYIETWENLVMATHSDWLWSGNLNNMKTASNQMELAMKQTAEVYDILLNVLKRKKINIPTLATQGEVVSPEDKDRYDTKILGNPFKVTELTLHPEKPTANSGIYLTFKVFDPVEGIDYNNIYLVYRVNNAPEYRRIRAKLGFDGTVRVFLGRGNIGDTVDYFLYLRSTKGKEGITPRMSFDITE
ncbi:hypothetical protein [Thermospira aquatica]|uniref:Glycoside hydrolase family 57 N-terminal domain-containing protein n=1 Tax=Thermospira aquatica TaxID=2828656 RepID=A0AAX3BC60_9SPIR|nr:hypothetical protein [Thermospira aquatica]URA09769.1 hypothetical protein KDW03_09820 [Thermospira aquatica]